MSKKYLTVIAIVVLLVVGGGAFYAGTVYQKAQTPVRSFSGANFGTRTRTGAGAGFVQGSILSKDATSITLQLPNNMGSKIIFYSDTTQISKFAQGSATDLANGANISVTGTTNSDGSVTAQNIQIRPALPTK